MEKTNKQFYVKVKVGIKQKTCFKFKSSIKRNGQPIFKKQFFFNTKKFSMLINLNDIRVSSRLFL